MAAGQNFVDRERAAALMRRLRLDALVVSSPINVYYLTGAFPVTSRFSQHDMTAAVLPADLNQPIAYVSAGFEFYSAAADLGLAPGVEAFLVGGSFTDHDPRMSPAFPIVGSYALDARETQRRAMTAEAAPFYADMGAALKKALGPAARAGARIGFDERDAEAWTREAIATASTSPADDFMLHLRLIKTPAELELLRIAARNNVDATLITARAAREEGTVRRIRQRFFAEAARAGNVPVYGNVDLVVTELADGELREGQAFMVDFVSHYGYYQGDFGRTVFKGEPNTDIRRAAAVASEAWADIRARLKPGVTFSDIRRMGIEAVKRLNAPFTYAFNPHGVGLQHWDHPQRSLEGATHDIVLEPGMLLSIDCPLLNTGLDGSVHLEDLMLITHEGSKPIHETGHEVIVV